eukprot:132688-Rhodomonas_salina.2
MLLRHAASYAPKPALLCGHSFAPMRLVITMLLDAYSSLCAWLYTDGYAHRRVIIALLLGVYSSYAPTRISIAIRVVTLGMGIAGAGVAGYSGRRIPYVPTPDALTIMPPMSISPYFLYPYRQPPYAVPS